MPSDDNELAVVRDRLGAVVTLVLQKAESDPEFARQLKEVLVSDAVRAKLGKSPGGRSTRTSFDPRAYGRHNLDALRAELSQMSQKELEAPSANTNWQPPTPFRD